jgi:hypothetical protein
MACKRSGVRIPIAPQLMAVNRNLSRRFSALYSSKSQQRPHISGRTPVRIRSPLRSLSLAALLFRATEQPCGQPERLELIERGAERPA